MRLSGEQRRELRPLLPQLRALAGLADSTRRAMVEASENGQKQTIGLSARVATLTDGRGHRWKYLSLWTKDLISVAAIAAGNRVDSIADADWEWVLSLAADVEPAIELARQSLGFWKHFWGKSADGEAGAAALQLLEEFPEANVWAIKTKLEEFQRSATPGRRGRDVEKILSSQRAIAAKVEDTTQVRTILEPQLKDLASSLKTLAGLREILGQRRRLVRKAANIVKNSNAREILKSMSVERLVDVTEERIPVRALKSAGLDSVQDVLEYGEYLTAVPGVGEVSRRRILGAARTLERIAAEEAVFRIDTESPSHEAKEVIARLWEWDAARLARASEETLMLGRALSRLIRRHGAYGKPPKQVVIFGDREPLDAAIEETARLSGRVRQAGGADSWKDFLERPAYYYALLDELGIIGESTDAVEGGLPAQIVKAIRSFTLDTSRLRVSLRGYQHFAARFALVQRKVIIGDEMGLGKTIEALAVFAHLAATGKKHFLVICPAAVLTNWVREVRSKSTLPTYEVHGKHRDVELRRWGANGGVAVTTFGMLPSIKAQLDSLVGIDALAIDEAHYIKNPLAQRSKNSAKLILNAEYAMLLTGTPLENRVIEFRNLVRYLKPELEVDVDDLRPHAFKRQVAPAYLRRNQEDVLSELPELIEVDEWVPLVGEERRSYREEVAKGTFHSMRQSAMLSGNNTAKLQRLKELVEEAGANDRKSIVYTNYLAVAEKVSKTVPMPVFGPLTGSVPPAKRQKMIDNFAGLKGPAVLVSQIQAGGVGLNIQAASVVIITEPQLKPTTEWQAIGRAHRMGQLRSVQVHRLLSERSVDSTLTDLLAKKGQVFKDFAAVSEIAESAPEAFDISDADLVRAAVAAEQARLETDDEE